MNIDQIISQLKSPQAVVSFLSSLVAVLGTVGILNAPFTGALQAVLTAVLGLVVAFGHTSASVALVRLAARRAQWSRPLATD